MGFTLGSLGAWRTIEQNPHIGWCFGVAWGAAGHPPNARYAKLGVVAGAIAAIGFAGSIMATKRLTRSETIWTVLFYMTLMQLVFGAVCAGADGDIALPSLSNMPWVVLIACAGLFAHLCLTSALSLAPATVVVPVDLLRLPVIMLVGFSLYGEVIDIYVVLGALVIFGANYMNIWIETRVVKPASKGVEPTG